MHILVTGSNGQLGSEIKEQSHLYPEYEFHFTDIDDLDISNEKAVNEYIEKHYIKCVINCAAYTNVDKAESEPELANKINVLAVKYLAKACTKYNAQIMHISTDYVFDGKNYRPYRETDFTNPQSVYGKTKLEGEKIIEEFAKTAVIIRTSWLYSSYGNNFVKTMLKYGKERDELNVVFDQIGSPTYAANLANIALKNIADLQWIQGTHIYHYSDEGVCSWYDFAKAIMDLTGTKCKINAIESSDYPLPARRPYYSVLNKEKIKNSINECSIPHWQDALKECLKKIK
ncbi:MAG: dTDP-4-dehydrorhamnose reductase [Bacteroidetes bacterium]|nr:MAG: dTDP-4-dehydrorhamnose reductase [Bacteroidota bacterium]